MGDWSDFKNPCRCQETLLLLCYIRLLCFMIAQRSRLQFMWQWKKRGFADGPPPQIEIPHGAHTTKKHQLGSARTSQARNLQSFHPGSLHLPFPHSSIYPSILSSHRLGLLAPCNQALWNGLKEQDWSGTCGVFDLGGAVDESLDGK